MTAWWDRHDKQCYPHFTDEAAKAGGEHSLWASELGSEPSSLVFCQIKCFCTSGAIVKLDCSLRLEYIPPLKVFKSSEGAEVPIIFPRSPRQLRHPASHPHFATGISDVWTTVALWWPTDKELHSRNSENKDLPPLTGQARSGGGSSFILGALALAASAWLTNEMHISSGKSCWVPGWRAEELRWKCDFCRLLWQAFGWEVTSHQSCSSAHEGNACMSVPS